jgi:hypothetical protein
MMIPTSTPSGGYFLCLSNGGHPASLEVRKIYQGVADPPAERRGLLRVIDESGEDYLYPSDLFVPIKLTSPVMRALAKAQPPNKAMHPTGRRPRSARQPARG